MSKRELNPGDTAPEKGPVLDRVMDKALESKFYKPALAVFMIFTAIVWILIFKYFSNFQLACFARCQEACPVTLENWRAPGIGDTALPFAVKPNISDEYEGPDLTKNESLPWCDS